MTRKGREFHKLIQYLTDKIRSSSTSAWFNRIEKGLFTQALSDSFLLGRGTSQYGGDGLPAVSSTGDFGFESIILSQAYPEADTKWAVNSIEVCLSGSGHPACRTLPPRGRPHCWRPGTHGDKSDCPWPSATIFRRVSKSAVVVRLYKNGRELKQNTNKGGTHDSRALSLL